MVSVLFIVNNVSADMLLVTRHTHTHTHIYIYIYNYRRIVMYKHNYGALNPMQQLRKFYSLPL